MPVWQGLRDQVATLDEELERYRRSERDAATASEAAEAAGVTPIASRSPARALDNAGVRTAGNYCPSPKTTCLSRRDKRALTILYHGCVAVTQDLCCAGGFILEDHFDADITHHKHLAELLKSVAAETEALEHSGLQASHLRFLAEVRAMQLAASNAQVSSTADLAGQPARTQTPHNADAASHDPILHSGASHAGPYTSESAIRRVSSGLTAEGFLISLLEGTPGHNRIASALTAVVSFLLHGVLSMQPGSLQSSYATSALSFISAVHAAWPGEFGALGPILEILLEGLF